MSAAAVCLRAPASSRLAPPAPPLRRRHVLAELARMRFKRRRLAWALRPARAVPRFDAPALCECMRTADACECARLWGRR